MRAIATSYGLSKRGYYADFVTVPLATSVAMIWLFSLHTVNAAAFGLAVITGAGAWTFAEYAIHRWSFHGNGPAATYASEHRMHHIHPAEFIGASPVTTALVGAFGFWILTLLFGPALGVGLLVGLVLGYLFYIFVHDQMHHSTMPGKYFAKLNAAHELHHRRFKVNYGIITPFWDHVFGTYEKPEV